MGGEGASSKGEEVKKHGWRGDWTLGQDKGPAPRALRGWKSRIVAEGKVQGNSPSGNLEAESGDMEMWPGVNQAKLLTLRGNVRVNGRDPKSGMTRSLTSNAVQLTFVGGKAGEANRVQHADTLERGEMEWLDAAAVRCTLAADKLAVGVCAQGNLQLFEPTHTL